MAPPRGCITCFENNKSAVTVIQHDTVLLPRSKALTDQLGVVCFTPRRRFNKHSAPNLASIHASRESICFGQLEHGMWPVRQMVLRCKLPNPSSTS
eukprot:32803-Pelagomonas_calceolata.AAC.1